MRRSALVFPSHELHIKVGFTRPSDSLRSCGVCSQCVAAAASSPQKNISLVLFNYSPEVVFQVSQNPNISPSSCLSAYVNRIQQVGPRLSALFIYPEGTVRTHPLHHSLLVSLGPATVDPQTLISCWGAATSLLHVTPAAAFFPRGYYCSGVFRFFFPPTSRLTQSSHLVLS